MMYPVPPVMISLIERFPNSQDLFTWLRSEEGGQLIVREDWMRPDQPLVLIHYQKGQSNLDLPHVGAFRSVVWDAAMNRPVALSPPRRTPFSHAIDTGVLPTDGVVEDFVDGVMINLFWYAGAWCVATHTVIGGDCAFYGRRSFATLFWEAFAAHGCDARLLEPGASYSFVLQHPEERVVSAPAGGVPHLVLVETYGASPLGVAALARLRPTTHVGLSTLEDLKSRVASWGARFGPAWMGLVLKMPDGRRYTLRSTPYEAARALRGNESNRRCVWLDRWKQGTLGAYLAVFPEEREAARALVEAFKALTLRAHGVYTDIYRDRKYPLGAAPREFRRLLWTAHAEKKGAYFPDFRAYMNALDTPLKLWLLRQSAAAAARQPNEMPAVPSNEADIAME